MSRQTWELNDYFEIDVFLKVVRLICSNAMKSRNHHSIPILIKIPCVKQKISSIRITYMYPNIIKEKQFKGGGGGVFSQNFQKKKNKPIPPPPNTSLKHPLHCKIKMCLVACVRSIPSN